MELPVCLKHSRKGVVAPLLYSDCNSIYLFDHKHICDSVNFKLLATSSPVWVHKLST